MDQVLHAVRLPPQALPGHGDGGNQQQAQEEKPGGEPRPAGEERFMLESAGFCPHWLAVVGSNHHSANVYSILILEKVRLANRSVLEIKF